MIWTPDQEFHCSADQDFSLIDNPNFKNNLVHKIFVRKLMKLMQNQKRFRNKVTSPKEFFQNSIRKRK